MAGRPFLFSFSFNISEFLETKLPRFLNNVILCPQQTDPDQERGPKSPSGRQRIHLQPPQRLSGRLRVRSPRKIPEPRNKRGHHFGPDLGQYEPRKRSALSVCCIRN